VPQPNVPPRTFLIDIVFDLIIAICWCTDLNIEGFSDWNCQITTNCRVLHSFVEGLHPESREVSVEKPRRLRATPNYIIDPDTHTKHKNPQENPSSVKLCCYISIKKTTVFLIC
jgi:hypothetical protein